MRITTFLNHKTLISELTQLRSALRPHLLRSIVPLPLRSSAIESGQQMWASVRSLLDRSSRAIKLSQIAKRLESASKELKAGALTALEHIKLRYQIIEAIKIACRCSDS